MFCPTGVASYIQFIETTYVVGGFSYDDTYHGITANISIYLLPHLSGPRQQVQKGVLSVWKIIKPDDPMSLTSIYNWRICI